jgi:hypothetical protein
MMSQKEKHLDGLSALAEPLFEAARAAFLKTNPSGMDPEHGSHEDFFPSPERREFVAAKQLLNASRFFKSPTDVKGQNLNPLHAQLSTESGLKSPEALAWMWSELSEEEEILVPAMDASMLTHWLAGSFSPLHDGFGLSEVGSERVAREGEVSARTWGDENATIRRASRAKTLGILLEGNHRWNGSVKSMAAMAKSMAGASADPAARQLLKGAKQAAFKTTQRWRAGAVTVGGFGSWAASAMAGVLLPNLNVTTGLVAGFGSICLGLAMLCRAPSPFQRDRVEKSKLWGPGTMSLLALAYPDFHERGVFKTWRSINPSRDFDHDGAYLGYEMAGCGNAQSLAQVSIASHDLPTVGGDGLKAWAQRRELDSALGEFQPHGAPSQKNQKRL